MELRGAVERPDRSSSVEVTGYLARFLIVRSCGYLEQVVDESCRAYLKSKAAPGAAAFGSSWLGHGRNPMPKALERLVARFNLGLEAELEELFSLDGGYLGDQIASLVDRRNKIAHGMNETTGAQKALNLVDAATKTADWFVLRLDPRA